MTCVVSMPKTILTSYRGKTLSFEMSNWVLVIKVVEPANSILKFLYLVLLVLYSGTPISPLADNLRPPYLSLRQRFPLYCTLSDTAPKLI